MCKEKNSSFFSNQITISNAPLRLHNEILIRVKYFFPNSNVQYLSVVRFPLLMSISIRMDALDTR